MAAGGATLALLPDSAITAARFSTLRNDHTALRAFLQRMPKGADLHVHLSGAVFAEDLIAWAAREGLCVRLADATFVPPSSCELQKAPAVADAMLRQNLYDAMVNALFERSIASRQSRLATIATGLAALAGEMIRTRVAD